MHIKNSYIQINDNNDYPFKLLDNEEERFGILNIELDKVEIAKSPIFILFTVDTTGSMTDYSSNNKTKMEYAIQTLKSIMKYLSLYDINVTIQINTFNIETEILIEPIIITKDNVKDIIEKIDAIDADFVTNIEKALETANNCIHEYKLQNSDSECVHIFMTDGEPTAGSLNTNELVNCVSDDYISINIGFGDDHNATLLSQLSNLKNGEYHFIDKIEKSSIVYGESLHKVLYPCLKNINISIENGLIYDWKTNEWKTEIYENVLISEMTKCYHVKTDDILNISANLIADVENVQEDMVNHKKLEEKIYKLPDLINNQNEIIVDNTITKFAFRQRVLEILYDAHRIKGNGEIIKIQKKLKDLFAILVKYMCDNEILEDNILNQLKNDLYITYWNIGTKNAMYINGRYMAQGNQSAYTPSNHILNISDNINIDDEIPRPILRRSRNILQANIFEIINDDLNIQYDSNDDEQSLGTTDNEYSCYSTPGTRNTVNTIRLYDD